MKLKTLKDLNLNLKINGEAKKILKAEAVKWVKEDIEMLVSDGEKGEYQQIVKDILIQRWMERLNLTEKDLKDAKCVEDGK